MSRFQFNTRVLFITTAVIAVLASALINTSTYRYAVLMTLLCANFMFAAYLRFGAAKRRRAE